MWASSSRSQVERTCPQSCALESGEIFTMDHHEHNQGGVTALWKTHERRDSMKSM